MVVIAYVTLAGDIVAMTIYVLQQDHHSLE